MTQIIKIGNKLARIGDRVLKYTPPSISIDLLDGLFAYYKLDGDGTDELGSYDLNQIVGGIYETGKIGQYYNGNGSTINLENNFFSSSISSFSISGWFWRKTFIESNNIFLGLDPTNLIFEFPSVSSNSLDFKYYDGSITQTISNIATIDNDEVLKHLVATYDQTSTTFKVYLNNIEIYSSSSISIPTQTYSAIYIANQFGGGLDEIGYWNRPLNSDEISELYNSGNGLSYDNF
jgi:hypothetical protein